MSFVLTDHYGKNWIVQNDNVTGTIEKTTSNDIKIDLTAKDGYKIVSANIKGESINSSMTVSNDGKTATKTFWERAAGGTVNVTTQAVESGGVVNNIPNSTDNSTFTDEDGYPCWSLQINANEGYRMATDATANYIDTDGNPETVTLSMNGAKSMVSKTLTSKVSANTRFEVSGATVDANQLDVTNNVPNTTLEQSGSGHNFTFTLKCNEGFKFDGKPKIAFTDWDYGDFTQKEFEVDADSTTATVTIQSLDTTETISISGNTVSAGVTDVTVVNNIADTTETHTFDGEKVTITVESARYPHWRFISPKVSYTDSKGDAVSKYLDVTVNQYNSTATVTITDIDPTQPLTLSGKFVNVVHVAQSLSNCTSVEPLPEFWENGETVTITLQTNPNTEFADVPTLGYNDDNGNPLSFDFTLSADKLTATITHKLPNTYNVQSATVYGNAEPKQVIGGNYGLINVYVVTLDNLQEFAKKRFFKETNSGGDVSYELIDLGQYVNRLKRIYTDIPTSSTDVIRCGNYNTKISCFAPSVDSVTLDFGTVTIPRYNNDNTDYQSEIQLFLPFRGFVNLPSDYVGKEINLTYIINVITANGVALLQHNGVTFQVEPITPNQDILFRTADEQARLIGNDDWNELLYYGIEPFVNCKWFESANRDERNATNERVVIGSVLGFNRFINPDVIATSQMLADEQTAIYNALQRGVYIE